MYLFYIDSDIIISLFRGCRYVNNKYLILINIRLTYINPSPVTLYVFYSI